VANAGAASRALHHQGVDPEIVGLRPRFLPDQLLRQAVSVVDFSKGCGR